ncbi:hypothetical protein [Selenomonas sp. oral taxon 149]|uniref:hypothetical protein n=1 Tax=Selenomonas sp. oral taxon 149 TaxID=712535 RepID=UPI0002F00F32|nr:hypothetical protein [Selenomonas sp. oral taxon 149]
MRHLRRSSAAVLLIVLLMFCAYMGFGYWKKHTPEAALAHIAHAVVAEDRVTFDQYVDTDAVLAGLSEDAVALLTENIDALHTRHPSDWFFRHDAAFMEQYMAERRAADIAFVRAALDYYFDSSRVPISRTDGTARWASDEMRAFAAAYTVTVGAVRTDGDRAEADAVLRGNDSTYGRLLPSAAVTFELVRAEDRRWKLVRVRTAADEHGFFAFVDAAERYWALQGWD